MPVTAARAVLRQSRLLIQRAGARSASTTSEVANTASSTATKAKETVSNVTSKASEGLSKVSSSASSTVSAASAQVSSAAGQAQGRIGRLVSGVQSLIPPTVYYARVGLELGRLVFKGQAMGPPSLAQIQPYYQPFLAGLRNPTNAFAHSPGLIQPTSWLESLRNMSSKDMAQVGVVAAEVLGFFTVGTIIGKLKIVGYRGEIPHHAEGKEYDLENPPTPH